MKKLIITVISLAVIALIAYTLYGNKKEMEENAKLSEVTSESIPVETTSLQKKSLNLQVTADGTFEAKTDLTILSETQGKVIKIYKEKGETVSKGTLLAQVENDLLSAQVDAADANLQKLQSDLSRFTKLAESDAVTQRQLEEVKIGVKNAEAQYKSAKKNLDNTYIRATTSGTINEDYLQEGGFIAGGSKLYDIVDISKLKLNVKLTANQVLQVKEGDEISITTSVYPGSEFTGKIKSIAVKADPSLKYNVEIELINKGDKTLKPGMYATAHFDFNSAAASTYLDRNALIGSIQNPQVYVVENGQAALKDIKVGEIYDDLIEVLGGLSTSDKVVKSGQINLTEGTKVKVL
ncbi:efflux RND transporter periplasmic adaptor subunit [Marinoscillum pacificum]|uniref:efflux RND transporter periplasmic adaptor subunit n=1 Tax=Marinoscillum pacificum TaxID=392723 RepID=UPI002157EEDF|nr:efflux RND transporter periplasmic adaptor subunit [Marinoscillum pacificum]